MTSISKFMIVWLRIFETLEDEDLFSDAILHDFLVIIHKIDGFSNFILEPDYLLFIFYFRMLHIFSMLLLSKIFGVSWFANKKCLNLFFFFIKFDLI